MSGYWTMPTSPSSGCTPGWPTREKASARWPLSCTPKGVDKELITSVLGGINPAAERGRAEELVRKKLRRENLSDEAADARVTRRLIGMLARRGFSQSMAFDVVSVELAGGARAQAGLGRPNVAASPRRTMAQ